MIIIHNINKNNKMPLYMQIYNYFKNSIISKELKEGQKLPSIRTLSNDLGVSKTTVENAYAQLEVEGFIKGKQRSGLYVEKIELADFEFKNVEEFDLPIIENDYINTMADRNVFDFKVWQKMVTKTMNEQQSDLLKVPSVNGEEVLRKEIASYARTLRGVNAHYNQIIVGSGTQYLLNLLAIILKDEYNCFAYEDPGYQKGAYMFENNGYKLVKIPLKDNEIDINVLNDENVKLLYVSPSHQYPTGSVMPFNNRINLIKWARMNNCYIIEDDYNSILRYDVSPISSLQGLSNNKEVIYIGSFSNLLLPSLRLSYMILPKRLIMKFEDIKHKHSQPVSILEQLTLANFMKEDYFDKHIRKLRKIQTKKSELLVDTFNNLELDDVELVSSKGGLNVLFKFKDLSYLSKVIDNCKSMNMYYQIISVDMLLFTYSGINLLDIEEVVSKMFEKRG